jgi:hypothetical protein
MQPYLFPYLGYFQLINAVDTFVIYDDVNFIKQGWINRNRILNVNKPFLFTLPLESISSFKKISETKINQALYEKWYLKFEKLIESNYKKAIHYPEVSYLLKTILNQTYDTINDLNTFAIKQLCAYLSIKTEIKSALNAYGNANLDGQQRVIDICLKENAFFYVNAPGGQQLYDKELFSTYNIELQFIRPQCVEYSQFNKPFIPGLSVIDVLMFNSAEETKKMLENVVVD